MAFPPNSDSSSYPGSFTSTISIFPFRSAPLKSSHWYSGAVIPYPAKTTSASADTSSATRFVQATKSSWNFSVVSFLGCPSAEKLSVMEGSGVMPTRVTFCT